MIFIHLGVLILAVSAGVGAAFACMMFYRRGLKDGMGAKNDMPPERIIALKEKEPEIDPMVEQLNAMVNFQPDHTETR